MNKFEHPGRIVAAEGLAAEIGLQPGDELLAINEHPVRDVIDVQFYAAEVEFQVLIRRDGELWLYEVERDPEQALGLSFEHPTFDTDIRRCNNRCLFCFVAQMPPRFRRSLYIKDDDYRYSFLEGNYVTLTNLSEDDWQRIAEQRLSPLYVSVHATEPGLRRELLGNANAPDVMGQLHRLASYGVEIHTQLVILPGVNDKLFLDRSVRDLAGLWPAVQSVSIVPVGLTGFQRAPPQSPPAGGRLAMRVNTPAEARAMLDCLDAWQNQFLLQWGDRFVYATDEWYLLAGRPVPPLDHYRQLEALQENGVGLVSQFLQDHKLQIANHASRITNLQSLTLVTGTLFAPVLCGAAAEFAELTGLEVQVRPVINTTLGETITVAGLLMGRDVIRELENWELGDRVVLPSAMFRGPGGVTLDGMTLDEIGAALHLQDRPVALAAGMGEVMG